MELPDIFQLGAHYHTRDYMNMYRNCRKDFFPLRSRIYLQASTHRPQAPACRESRRARDPDQAYSRLLYSLNGWPYPYRSLSWLVCPEFRFTEGTPFFFKFRGISWCDLTLPSFRMRVSHFIETTIVTVHGSSNPNF